MDEKNQLELQSLLKKAATRRRKLIPIWIKIFIWIFIVFGAFVPLIFLMALLIRDGSYSLAFYGLETHQPYSAVGLFIGFLFLFKGAAALALWTEKKWAFNLAIADAILGIITCLFVLLYLSERSSSYGLELVLLIPYLIWLLQNKKSWENF